MSLLRDEATGEPMSLICSLRDVSERQNRAEVLALVLDQVRDSRRRTLTEIQLLSAAA